MTQANGMPTYNQQAILFERRDRGNLKDYEQEISVRFMEKTGDLPAKVSVQVKTTEASTPLSFRFASPGDLEDFVVACMKGYRSMIERICPNTTTRGIQLDMIKDRIRKVMG